MTGKDSHRAFKLKAQLEQADEDATFDYFTSLPPELRERIYKLYFGSLGDFY